MRVNGEECPDFAGTVADFLARRGVPARGVAVALNGAIVSRSQWGVTVIPEGAEIEIVTAAAGG